MIKRRALLLAAVPLPSLAGPQTLADLLRVGDDDGAVRAVRRAVQYRHEYRRWPRPTADVLASGYGNCTDMAWIMFDAAGAAGVDRRLAHCITSYGERHLVTLVRRAEWTVLDPALMASALTLGRRGDLEIVSSTDMHRVFAGRRLDG